MTVHTQFENKEGPFGITWATPDHSIAQTGYVFKEYVLALDWAKMGPYWVEKANIIKVDSMCDHESHNPPVFGAVQNEHDTFEEVTVMPTLKELGAY